MKALDAFIGVQHELDKFASPSFEVEQFNYFINSYLNDYIVENYARYPLLQKDVDDIRSIVKTSTPLALIAGKVALPEDYRHMLKVHVHGKFTVAVGMNALNSETDFKNVERRLSNEQGYREDNYYLTASHKSPYYELEGNDLIVDLGPSVLAMTATINYITTPATIFLSPNPADNLNIEGNNTTIPFPLHVYHELVKGCARLFLENIESRRYPTKVQEKQMSAD
jgi:hypothetical protein